MLGAQCGWRWPVGGSKVYIDLGLGLVHFLKPKYSFGTYTPANAYKGLMPEEDRAQMETAEAEIQDGVDEAMQEYRDVVNWGPILAIASGITL